MTSIITTPSRALRVIPSDASDIPTPYLIASGTATSNEIGRLTDENTNFISGGVNVGDIVYIYGTRTAASIVAISDTSLKLNPGDAEITIGDEYQIYQQSPITGSQNQGCLLYVSCIAGEGQLQVTTAGNDVVYFAGLSSGVLPVRVKRAWIENRNITEDPIALW